MYFYVVKCIYLLICNTFLNHSQSYLDEEAQRSYLYVKRHVITLKTRLSIPVALGQHLFYFYIHSAYVRVKGVIHHFFVAELFIFARI